MQIYVKQFAQLSRLGPSDLDNCKMINMLIRFTDSDKNIKLDLHSCNIPETVFKLQQYFLNL